jgi:hypothetical protein
VARPTARSTLSRAMDSVYDLAERLQRLRQQFVGAEPPDLPTGHLQQPEEGRLYWTGTLAPVIGAAQFTLSPAGLYVPAGAAAGPAPIDAMAVFLTGEDLLGRPLTTDQVGAALAAASAEDFIGMAAALLGRLEAHGTLDMEFQRTVATELFGQPTLARVQNAISNGQRLLAPQVLLAVMKAALMLCPADRPSTRFKGGIEPFLAVMLGIAQWLGAEPPAPSGTWGGFPEWLSLEVIRNQAFNAESTAGAILTRYQRLWRELPGELAGAPGAIDVDAAFRRATGIGLDHLLAVGFPMLAGAGEGKIRFPPSYFTGSALPADQWEAALRLLAVDLDQMRVLVDKDTTERGFDWGFTAFHRYPILRTASGDLILLSGKFLLERIAGGAAYWELDEHFKQQGKKAFLGFRIFHGRVVERHIRDGVEAMVGELPGGRRIWDEADQQAAWGKTSRRGRARPEKACDLLIDYGWAWVCLEVVSGRLTQKSLARGSGQDFDRDVDKLVEDKLEQLDTTIRNLRAREEALTGRPAIAGKRFFPVVVAGYGFPVNPITMSVIRQRATTAGLLQGPDVGAVEVLDFDMLEQVEAMAEQGGPNLAELLRDKQTANLRLASLDQYMHYERRLALRRPGRLDPILRRAFDRILELHGLDGEADRGQARSA